MFEFPLRAKRAITSSPVIGSVSQAVAEVCAIIPTLFPRREGY
jgi:hypothetical protein